MQTTAIKNENDICRKIDGTKVSYVKQSMPYSERQIYYLSPCRIEI